MSVCVWHTKDLAEQKLWSLTVCSCSRILSESEIDVHLVALSEREWGKLAAALQPLSWPYKNDEFEKPELLTPLTRRSHLRGWWRQACFILFRRDEVNTERWTLKDNIIIFYQVDKNNFPSILALTSPPSSRILYTYRSFLYWATLTHPHCSRLSNVTQLGHDIHINLPLMRHEFNMLFDHVLNTPLVKVLCLDTAQSNDFSWWDVTWLEDGLNTTAKYLQVFQ